MGSEYSVADAHLFVVSSWASWVNFDLSPYRSVLAFCERVRARPAVIAALKGPLSVASLSAALTCTVFETAWARPLQPLISRLRRI
jgi:hypothetical protein